MFDLVDTFHVRNIKHKFFLDSKTRMVFRLPRRSTSMLNSSTIWLLKVTIVFYNSTYRLRLVNNTFPPNSSTEVEEE